MKFGRRALILSLALTAPMRGAMADEDASSGIPIHGFADAGWAMDNQKDSDLRRGYARGFYLENVDLYLAKDLGNRVKFLTEIVLEPGFDDQSIGIDTERLQIGYNFSNLLTAWVGRFHTPLGFSIIAYHHGAQLQTAASKPRFLDFEDHFGVVPDHTTGLWLTGNVFLGESRIGYMAWIGNGDRLSTDDGGTTTLDMNMVHDDNRDTTMGARLTVFPGGALEGAQLGFSLLRQRVDYVGNTAAGFAPLGAHLAAGDGLNPYNGLGSFASNLFIYGMHLVYENHGIEFLNEIYGFHNSTLSDPGAPTYNSFAGYTQLAYWIQGVAAPYVRLERGDFNSADPFFSGQTNGLGYFKAVCGMRYDLNDASALKLEFSHTALPEGNVAINAGSFNEVRTQYAIRF